MLDGSSIKLLLVDDHPVVREGLTKRLAQCAEFSVCGEAHDVLEAMQIVSAKKPDIVIADITLRKSDGIDLIRRISALDDAPCILVWSMHSETTYAERAMRAGAKGYITKEQPTDEVVVAIRQILAGKVYLSPAMRERILQRSVGHRIDPAGERVNTLSDRELEVLRYIGNGVRDDEVARQMHLSVKTVETYKGRIKKKLNLKDGVELLQYSAVWILNNP